MPVISLMTDFGLKDGNIGVMKGVIWAIAPQVQIADLSHLVAPQNIREASLLLSRSAPFFPEGSIHVVVVDPGVGTVRRPMAAKIGSQYYVGPDNGTITLLLEQAEKDGVEIRCVNLDQPGFWLPKVSHVFHGRDIFSPVAAHLSLGTPLEALGTEFDDPIRLELPAPVRTQSGWKGEVIHIDHFGNIASNLRVEHLGEKIRELGKIKVRTGGIEINGMVNTFGERPVGDLIALSGSTGNLLVSVVNGNAAARLNAKVGDTFEIIFD